MGKRIFLSLIAFLMALATAFAGEVTIDGIKYYYEYSSSGSNLTARVLVQDGKSKEGVVEIPVFITVDDNMKLYVTAISSGAFDGNTKITKVIIPGCVGSIGGSAFRDCTALKEVDIKTDTSLDDAGYSFTFNGLTKIEDGAFQRCTSLESINLPETLTYLGDAFSDCISLTAITLPSSLTTLGGLHGPFGGCSNLKSISIPAGVKTIPYRAFHNCTSLESVTFNGAINVIGEGAFWKCSSLKSIDLSKGIKQIDGIAFQESGLESISFPKSGLEKIAGNCFASSALKSIDVPASVTFIGGAFCGNCKELTEAVIQGGVYSSSESGQFTNCTKLKKATITWTGELAGSMFKGCSSLETVILKGDITAIGGNAFNGCSALQSLSLPNTVTDIGYYAFLDCSALQSLAIPGSVTTIKNSAFKGCAALASLALPSSLQEVQNDAFSGCSSLKSLTFPASMTTLGSADVFYNCTNMELIDFRACTNLPKADESRTQGTFRNLPETTVILWPGDQPAGIPIDEAHFPDENFRNYLLEQDYGQDGILTEEEITAITSINARNRNIRSMKGLEYFTAIIILSCENNQLTELDLSNNKKISSLYCNNNQLTTLEVSNVDRINCQFNRLTSIRVSSTSIQHRLVVLDCYGNQLKGAAVDALISDLPEKGGNIDGIWNENEGNVFTPEQVAAAKAKGWTIHQYLDGDWTEYAGGSEQHTTGIAIDATNFPDENFRNYLLSQDYGQDGILTDEEITNVKDISIRKANISDLKGIEFFSALEYLQCVANQLTTLDVSKNTALKELHCSSNQLTSLDVKGNMALEQIYCDGNQLTTLDLSKNTALDDIYCDDNQLTSIDVTGCIDLRSFSCCRNKLTSIDISTNTAMKQFQCVTNQISSLDVSQNTQLEELFCYDNQLTSLDVSRNLALKDLECRYNQITSLDVSKNTALEYFGCQGNQITTLDLKNNTALKTLHLFKNQLTSVILPDNSRLTSITCALNQLKGASMDALVNALPVVQDGTIAIILLDNEEEGNVCTKQQVAVATGKGWRVVDYYYGKDYAGSEEIIKIDTDDNNDRQDFFSADCKPISDAEVEISKVDSSEGDVQIPLKITIKGQEVAVTSIAEGAFADNTALTSVTIPSSVTNIGDGAFSGCENLEYLDLSAANISNMTSSAISGLSEKTVVVLPEAMSATNAQTLSQASTNVVYKEDGDYKSANVKLTDGEKFNAPASVSSITVAAVTYPRSFSSGDVVYSICLPYSQLIPTGMKAYELVEFSGSNLVFKEVTNNMEATKPYLLKASSSVSDLNASNVVMNISGSTIDKDDVESYSFCGSLERISNAEASGCLILQSDKMWHPVGAKEIPANRAYLKKKANAARITGTVFVDSDGTTSIKTIDRDGTENYYDLQGHRISKPTKAGIYVKDGRKTIVK